VKGVCTLAGYARAANGHTLAFVILNQGSMSASAVRRWQDKVCEAMCH
jgi:D-alanyl-D-alanine carboxypeptidase/D-alanyl-D-alanine-endopeptidase (penicillin-binding protein 4)